MKIKKTLIMMVVLISVSFSVNAGFVSKGVKVGAVYTFLRFATPAIIRGSGKRATGLALKKFKKSSPENHKEALLILTVIAVGNEKYKENIKDIMKRSGDLTSELNSKIDKESKEFEKAKAIFTTKANDIDKKYKKRNCDTYKHLMTDYGYPSDLNYIHNPVQEWDVGSYGDLAYNSMKNDNLEHDHIPSKQAVENFLKNKGYTISKKVKKNINQNSTTIEVSKENHIKGATYGGKQNSKINGIAKKFFDSEDLRVATIRDMSYHFINSKDSRAISAFFPLYKRNLELCLYN